MHEVIVVTIQRGARRVWVDGIFGPIHADLKHRNGSTLQVVHTIDARIGVYNPTVSNAPDFGPFGDNRLLSGGRCRLQCLPNYGVNLGGIKTLTGFDAQTPDPSEYWLIGKVRTVYLQQFGGIGKV